MSATKLQVFLTPLGASMREQFCQEARSYAYAEAVLVLPTGLLQEKVRQQYNLPVCGFDTLANKILNLNGYASLQEINRHSQELLVAELVDYYVEQGQLRYFEALRDKKGFIKNMTSLLGQLSRSGATVSELSTALAAWDRSGAARAKDEEVARVYSGYRTQIRQSGQYDLEGKYRLALKVLREREQVKLPWTHIYLCDFSTLDPLQLELLVELAQHCEVQVGISYEPERKYCELSRPMVERLSQVVKPQHVQGNASLRSADLQNLVACFGREGTQRLELEQPDCICIREYRHQRAELEGVLTEIKEKLAGGAAYGDFAVVMRDLNNYAGLRLQADTYGLPLDLPKVEKLLGQPLTVLVRLLLDAVRDSRQGVDAYLDILSSALGKLLTGGSVEKWCQLQERQFFTRRSQLQQALQESLEEEPLPAFLQAVDSFLENCPGFATMENYTLSLEGFLDALELPKSLGTLYRVDKLSLQGLQELLGTLKELHSTLASLRKDFEDCGMAGEQLSLSEFREELESCLKECSLLVEYGRKDGILVVPAVQLQGASYKNVYVLGLREGEFPAGNTENWIYNDKERGELKALGIDLPSTARAYEEDNSLLLGILAAAQERLYLSFYKDEEGEDSPYIDEICACFEGLAVTRMEAKPVASVTEAWAQSPSCSSDWLEQTVGVEALHASSVDRERKGVYNGTISDQRLLEQVRERTHYCFSASSLTNYVKCPFMYLAGNLWGQQAASAKDESLEATTRGSLVHKVLEKFVSRYLHDKPSVEQQEALLQLLQQDFADVVAKFVQDGLLVENELWELEKAGLLQMLSNWLAMELSEQAQWASFNPVDLEREFGRKVELSLRTETGLPVKLRGRIDRVDASAELVFVSDYKTGTPPSAKDFLRGADVQIPFYLLAAKQLYPQREIAGGGYIGLKDSRRSGGICWKETGNPSLKVAKEGKDGYYASWEELRSSCEQKILEPVTRIYAGDFGVALEGNKPCQYCAFAGICRVSVLPKQAGEEEAEDE